MEDQLVSSAISYVIFTVLTLIPGWTIFRKAGFHPALALLIVIPLLGGIVFLAILAFAKWPALGHGGRG